jgi:hypothetical protein
VCFHLLTLAGAFGESRGASGPQTSQTVAAAAAPSPCRPSWPYTADKVRGKPFCFKVAALDRWDALLVAARAMRRPQSLVCVYVMQLCILNAVSFNRFLHILLRRKRHTDTDRDAVQVQRCTQTYIRTSPSKGRTAEERAWRNARNRAKAKAGTLPACSAGFLIQVRLDLSMIQFQWLYICHTHAPACFILAAAFQAAKFRRPACRTPPAA